MAGVRPTSTRILGPLREYSRISKRTLVVFGENDEFCFGDVAACVDVLHEFAPPRRCRFEVIEVTGHGFHDAEEILGERIAGFLVGK